MKRIVGLVLLIAMLLCGCGARPKSDGKASFSHWNPDAPVLQLVTREALDRLLYGSDDVQWYGQLMTRPQTIAYFFQLDYWMAHFGVKVSL